MHEPSVKELIRQVTVLSRHNGQLIKHNAELQNVVDVAIDIDDYYNTEELQGGLGDFLLDKLHNQLCSYREKCNINME